MADPEISYPPTGGVFRVGRARTPVHFSEIDPTSAGLATAGNRFDVPGGGVLYAGTTHDVCYAETLARYRPTAKMRQVLKDEHPDFMIVGGVPRDWRLTRTMATIRVPDPLPFLDVEHPGTQEHLNAELSFELVSLGYEGQLDISDLCNSDRRLSRAIANYAYSLQTEYGEPVYSGIRYCSRISPEWECWAIFDGTPIKVEKEEQILEADPALNRITKIWDLRVF